MGSGLTAVDVALSLQVMGHEQVFATSRHGLLPHSHPDEPCASRPVTPPSRPTPLSLLAWTRRTARENDDWDPVVDTLRPRTDELWQVATRIRAMRETGHLAIVSGGIKAFKQTLSGIEITLAGLNLKVGAVVNCSGSPVDVRRTTDHLVRCLLNRRIARPGPLALGLDTDENGCLPDTDGALWLVGPLRRGRCWETTVIPEIRTQAAALARSFQDVDDLVAV